MLEDLKYENYAGEVNSKFQLVEKDLELELIEVLERKSFPGQEVFSLIFRGPKDNFVEQNSYQMRHEKLGEGEIFLVPIALDDEGYKYEAGFNRLVAKT